MRAWSPILSLLPLIGCGGDNKTPVNPDAPKPPIDAAPPDAHQYKGFKANEGGEVRLEYVNFTDGTAAARVTAFNYKTSGSIPYFPVLNPDTGGCVDGDYMQGNWPTAQNPVAERVYEDPGEVVISGGPTAFTARHNTADGFDGVHRNHPANHYSFTFNKTANDAATYMTGATPYTVTYTGSPDIPAQVFPDALWLPANFMPTNPAFGSVAITANTDATFGWTVPTENNPADHPVYSFIGFTGPMGPSTFCAFPVNSGTMTVPAAMINKVIAKYPTGGTLGRVAFTHVTRELVDKDGTTGNRIDFISFWCYSSPFTVQ